MSRPLSSRDARATAQEEVDELRARLTGAGVAEDDEVARALKARVVLNAMFQFTGLASPDGVLLEANQTALDAGGIERREVVGRPVWETHWFSVSPETGARLREAIARATATGELVRYDVDVYATAHGTDTVPIDFSARPVHGSDGEVAFLVLEGRDIAEKKRAQQLKDQLFANVSHELRTPLTLVLGRAATLADDGRLPEAARETAGRIQDNARVLLGKVNDLLQVAALEGQGVEIAPEPVDLVALARWVAANVSSLAAERGVRLELECDASLPAVTDPEHVGTILVNLVVNACRFARDDGVVVLRVAAVDEELVLEVRDDGPGIPPAARREVFEPFHQLDQGPSRSHGGTGLGLSIVRQLAELLDGGAAVDEAPEGGARFRVRLPYRPADPQRLVDVEVSGRADAQVESARAQRRLEVDDRGPPPMGPAGRADAGRVLLVEDNRDLVRFLVGELSGTYDVEVAPDGLAALERLGELAEEGGDGIDVLVTDVMMPRLSGDELVHRLRGDASLPQPPVLVLTAREDQQLREEMLAGGADDFLVKPFSSGELLARIDNLVQPVRLRRELERTNAALERYASQVSHDLKTPLAAVIGFADTLLQGGEDLGSEERRAMLERIGTNGRRLAQLADELLDDVRGSATTDTVALDEALEEVTELLGDRIRAHDAEVAADGPLPPVRASRGAVRNVLLNLVENSLTYRDPTKAPRIVVTASDGDGEVEVTVADNGRGIAPEDRERVFRRGDRGSDAVKRDEHGTGLGLHGARQTLTRHEGEIWVADHGGPGTVLCFTLPAAR